MLNSIVEYITYNTTWFHFNVTVPEQNWPTTAQCLFNMWATKLRQKQLKVALIGEHCLALGYPMGLLAIAWQMNLTFFPNSTSWIQNSMCWIGQGNRLAGDVQRQQGHQAWGRLVHRLNQNT